MTDNNQKSLLESSQWVTFHDCVPVLKTPPGPTRTKPTVWGEGKNSGEAEEINDFWSEFLWVNQINFKDCSYYKKLTHQIKTVTMWGLSQAFFSGSKHYLWRLRLLYCQTQILQRGLISLFFWLHFAKLQCPYSDASQQYAVCELRMQKIPKDQFPE